MLFSLKNCKNH